MFFSFLSGVIQGERFNAIIGLITMAGYGVLFFVTLYLLKSKRDILFVTTIIILSMGVPVVYGVLQSFLDIQALSIPGLTELYGSPEEPVMIYKDGWMQVVSGRAVSKNIMWGSGGTGTIVVGHKIFSTFHHGNLFGAHLAIFIAFLSGLTFISFSSKKLPLFFFLVLAIVVLIFTNSRAALFATGIGLMGLLVSLSPINWFRLFSLVVVSFLIFLLIISLAVFFNYKITGVDPSNYLYYNFEPRYLELGKKVAISWQNRIKKRDSSEDLKYSLRLDGLADQRFRSWNALKIIFRKRHLRGILVGNAFGKTPYYTFYNFYLWMVFEIGLIGSILFFLFLGYIITISFRSLAHITDEKFKAIASGGLAGLIAGLTHNLFDAPFYYPPILANFWILAGIIVVSVKKDVWF